MKRSGAFRKDDNDKLSASKDMMIEYKVVMNVKRWIQKEYW